jgi:hypothetical protein
VCERRQVVGQRSCASLPVRPDVEDRRAALDACDARDEADDVFKVVRRNVAEFDGRVNHLEDLDNVVLAEAAQAVVDEPAHGLVQVGWRDLAKGEAVACDEQGSG